MKNFKITLFNIKNVFKIQLSFLKKIIAKIEFLKHN